MTTSSAVRERPIPFSGADVIAILAGQKTQARRAMKPQPEGPVYTLKASNGTTYLHRWDGREGYPLICPFGAPGDLLWVREKWWIAELDGRGSGNAFLVYDDEWRDGLPKPAKVRPVFPDAEGKRPKFGPHPSVHMPWWAHRLTLEIVSVRVERVQDISEADARGEGVVPLDGGPEDEDDRDWSICPTCGGLRIHNALGADYGVMFDVDCTACDTYRKRFRHLWDSINGKRDGCSWDANPWCWVIEFKRVQP